MGQEAADSSSPEGEETPSWIEIYRCPRGEGRCREFALVLVALGLDCYLEARGEECCLLVAPEAQARARAELAEYEAENQGWPPPTAEPSRISARTQDVIGYWSALLAGYALEKHQAFGWDWLEAGSAQAQRLQQGEWWRALTALTLHVDGTHLLNNLIFGTLFGLLLGNELGTGLTWLAVLLTGAAGNEINAYLQDPGHRSIGASTGIFGAIGMLVALQWRDPGQRRQSGPRRWAPPAIGAVFLGYLGTAGEQTDVLAHVAGMAAGATFGLLLGALPRRLPRTGRLQGVLGLAALLLLSLAWFLALSHP